MKYDSILKLANFYKASSINKNAGLLKYNQKLVDDIFAWAAGILAENIKNKLAQSKAKSPKKATSDIINLCNQYPRVTLGKEHSWGGALRSRSTISTIIDLKEYNSDPYFANATLSISLEDSRGRPGGNYAGSFTAPKSDPYKARILEEERLAGTDEEEIALTKQVMDDSDGEFSMRLKITSACTDSLSMVKNEFSDLALTIRHEIQHFSQFELKKDKRSDQAFGLPSKKMTHQWADPNGVITGVMPKNILDKSTKWIKQDNPAFSAYDANIEEGDSQQLAHSLIDAEFYTNLTDQVELFKRYYGNLDEASQRRAARVIVSKGYISPNSSMYDKNKNPGYFFWFLKEYAPEKWKKAVVEFYKAIGLKDSREPNI